MSRRSALALKGELGPVPRLCYRIDEAVQATGLSKTRIEKALAKGELRSVKRLGVRLIPASALEEFVGA